MIQCKLRQSHGSDLTLLQPLQLRQQWFGKEMLLGLHGPLVLQVDPQAFLQEYLRVFLALQVQGALVLALVQMCHYITSLQAAGLHLLS